MTKQEFLETMRLALNGKVAPGLVTENLQFYEDYINTEVRKGKAEGEVLTELGDPRLLARTIVEAKGAQASGPAESADWGWQEGTGGEYQPYEQPRERRLRMLARVPVWAWLALVFLIVVLVLGAVFSLLAAILPIILPIALVLFAVKLFRAWMN